MEKPEKMNVKKLTIT